MLLIINSLLIEDSIKKLQIQKEMREQEDDFDFDEDEVDGLKDKDYEEYFEEIQEQKQRDIKIMYGDEEGE